MDLTQIQMLEKLTEMKGVHVLLSRFFDFSEHNVRRAHRQLLESSYIDMDGDGDWITKKGKKALEEAKKK